MIEDDLAVMRHVVAAAAAAGRLPARALSGVQICAVPPPLAVRNRLQEAQADQILVRSGAISVQTMAMRNGLDSDHEQQLIADRGDLHEANFNPDEPRDERGRWTTGGPGDGTVPGFFSISDPVGGSSAPSGPSGTAAPSSPPSGGGTAASGHTTAGSPPANAPAPTTKPAPKYEPEKWNNDPAVKGSNNCYSYALDRPKLPNGNPRPEGKPQPGEAAGNPVDDDHYDTDLNAAAKRDAYGVKDLPADGKCPPGYHKIQGFYDPSGSDYHWYRQDADGTWLQKHGKGEATNKDADGKVITDPNKANNNYGPGLNYSKACPVLIAPN